MMTLDSKYEMNDKYYRSKWFREDRFGMFIHWGLYAIPARGEWVRSIEQIPAEEYEPFQYEFDPVDYDPVQWARLAKRAGMKYAVLTAKHHDGFCLFDTDTTDFKAPAVCGRDLVREYVDAFRAEGIKVGLYYSIIDWHHPDFPHYGDLNHPMRNRPEYSNENRDFDRYLDYMFKQIRQLCTNYGKIDILWFDYSYDNMVGEKWKATELVQMVRSLQPHVIMDNRLEVGGHGFGSLITENPTVYSGDFVSPEQIIPPNGIRDHAGNLVPWEACITMNNNWGYHATDKYFKPAEMIIRKLVECVSKDGNLLVNVGPDPRGNIPEESIRILEEVGSWMHRNGKSIYGCGGSGMEKPEYGRITRRDNYLYYHVCESQVNYVYLPGIKVEQVKKVRLLKDGTELHIITDWITTNYPDLVFVDLGRDPILPEPWDTVIEVELYGEMKGK